MADRQRFPMTYVSGGDGGCSTSISGTNGDQLSQLSGLTRTPEDSNELGFVA